MLDLAENACLRQKVLLIFPSNNDEEKTFLLPLIPGANVIKLFTAVSYEFLQ